jgi:hypothetical protein
VFCHQCPTEACDGSNPVVREPSGQCSLTRKGGDPTVRRGHDCQHQGGAGARADGTTNTREPLLNAVTDDKPKVLSGLNQKVRGWRKGSRLSCRRPESHRRISGV